MLWSKGTGRLWISSLKTKDPFGKVTVCSEGLAGRVVDFSEFRGYNEGVKGTRNEILQNKGDRI
jgi:hypothetical protein